MFCNDSENGINYGNDGWQESMLHWLSNSASIKYFNMRDHDVGSHEFNIQK